MMFLWTCHKSASCVPPNSQRLDHCHSYIVLLQQQNRAITTHDINPPHVTMLQSLQFLFEFVESSDWFSLSNTSKLFNVLFKRFVTRIRSDISMGKSLIGGISIHHPSNNNLIPMIPNLDWTYIAQNIHWRFPTSLSSSCDCNGRCTDCQCSVQFGYHYDWKTINNTLLPVLNKSVVDIPRLRECHERCSCIPSMCRNRVTQRNYGISFYLQFDPNTQWGLYSDTLILKGQFVIEFVGEVLNEKEKRDRGIKNFMLTVNEMVENDIIHSVTIDPRRYGNAARFINHSCSPNLIPQLVWTLTDIPSIKLFALCDIEKDKELTFHYGMINDVRSNNVPSSQRCFCKSNQCQGYLPHFTGS